MLSGLSGLSGISGICKAGFSPLSLNPTLWALPANSFSRTGGQFTAASSQYLSGSSPAVTPKLWSFTGWFLKSSASAGVSRTISHFRGTTPVVWEIKVDHVERFSVLTRDDAGTVVLIVLGTITLDQWYHFAVVRDDNTLLYYLNGELKSSVTGTQGTFTPTYFQIGQQWDGLLDNLSVYDYALSASQVSALYNSGAGVAFEDFGGVLDTLPVHGWLDNSLTADAFGSNTLTNNNGVTQAAGKVNAVAVDNDPTFFVDDATPNDNDLTQVTLASRPLYKSAGYWTFDGVNDTLLGTLNLSSASKVAAFMVVDPDALGANQYFAMAENDAFGFRANGAIRYFYAGSSSGGYASSDSTDTKQILLSVYDGTQAGNANRIKGYINGGSNIIDTYFGTVPATVSATALQVAGTYPGAVAPFAGKLYELSVFENLTIDQINAMGQYLADTHGLTWTDI